MQRAALLSVLALWACSKPAAPQAAAAPEAPRTVTLQFGWQPGWSAAFHTVQESESDGKVLLIDSEGTLRVTAHAQGLQLDSASDTHRFERFEGGQTVPMDPSERQFLQAAAVAKVPIVVGTDAAFLGVPDKEASLAAVSEELERFYAATLAKVEDPEARAPAEELVEKLRANLMPAGLVGAVEQYMGSQWAMEVADWTGGTFEIGETYQYEFESMHPSGAALPWMRTFVVTGPQPCHEGKDAPACVRIDFRTEADSEALGALTMATMRPMLEAAGLAEAEVLATMVKEGSVLTEPSTLRPWSSRYVDTAETSVVVGDVPQRNRKVTTMMGDYVWER